MNVQEISLPKWPQMIVTGKTVTIDQAKEIIFRTDRFLTDTSEYSGGNNREFNAEYRRWCGFEGLTNDQRWDLADQLRSHFEILMPSYVTNNWASCSFIFGAHGWCSPKGQIYYIDNVGKWPTVEDIYQDWLQIAEAFPFIEANVTLMSGEQSENTYPLFNLAIKDGSVTYEKPDLSVHTHSLPYKRDFDEFATFLSIRNELGLPTNWYIEFSARIRKFVDSYFKH